MKNKINKKDIKKLLNGANTIIISTDKGMRIKSDDIAIDELNKEGDTDHE